MRVETTAEELCSVLVIGGGPAGSVAGSWLAQNGVDAILLEKARFPRFHIGESLLPNGNRILKEIGVWEAIEQAGFIEKYGAEFTLPDRSRSVRNVFAHGLVQGLDKAYQVERSRFDEILLRHAEKCGCQTNEATAVEKVERVDGIWIVQAIHLETGLKRSIRAKWIIDASGRQCVMGRALRIEKETIPYPGRLAVFNHFEGVSRSPGKEGGDIVVVRLRDAWIWMIPISQSITSVGVVAQKGSGKAESEAWEAFFWRKVGQSSLLSETLSLARATGEFRVESDYCYSYQEYGKENVLLAGDAASFIDPVFSSGVFLALESGLLAAKTVRSQLRGRSKGVSAFVYLSYTKAMKRRIAVMRRMIELYYDNKSYEVFMSPTDKNKLPEAVNSILAGCALPPWPVRWRFWAFRLICRLHRKRKIVPSIRWSLASRKSMTHSVR